MLFIADVAVVKEEVVEISNCLFALPHFIAKVAAGPAYLF